MERKDMFGNVEILLFDILQELKKLNEIKPETKPEIKEDNLDDLKRADLMAKVKELADKPQGWTKLSNEELKSLLKRGVSNGI